jgi:phosphonoacetate hydrolase
MMDASLLRSETLLGLFSRQGVATVAITAKDKLRKALGKGLQGICFSSEHADRCTLAEHGIERVEELVGRLKPDQYSADLSLFVLDAGIRLLEQHRAARKRTRSIGNSTGEFSG